MFGLIKFLASAAERNGAIFTLNGVARRAWGLEPQASLGHILRALKGVADFTSSLRLTAWAIGAWPALMTGAQTTMSSGWILRHLFDFCRALPERCEFRHNVAESSSEEEMGESKKRNVEGDEAPQAEPNK